jgi:hypothetical protein
VAGIRKTNPNCRPAAGKRTRVEKEDQIRFTKSEKESALRGHDPRISTVFAGDRITMRGVNVKKSVFIRGRRMSEPPRSGDLRSGGTAGSGDPCRTGVGGTAGSGDPRRTRTGGGDPLGARRPAPNWAYQHECAPVSRARGFPHQTLSWEEGGDFHFIGSTLVSFRAGGYEADGSTEAVFACALAESGRSGVGLWARSRGRAVAIPDQSQVLSGEVSASNSAQGSPSRPSGCVPVVLVA